MSAAFGLPIGALNSQSESRADSDEEHGFGQAEIR